MDKKLFDKNTYKNIKIHGFYITEEMCVNYEDPNGKKKADSCILVALENYSN